MKLAGLASLLSLSLAVLSSLALTACGADPGSEAPARGAATRGGDTAEGAPGQSEAALLIAGKDYLALGDSIAFGYNPLIQPPATGPFVGYPETTGLITFSSVTNAACPGETSASFLVASAPDNGCKLFKQYFPLKYAYAGSQMEAAEAYLKARPNTGLVTFNIGGNDLLLLAQSCAGDPACIGARLQTETLPSLAANTNVAFQRLRAVYPGLVVVMTGYSTDYANELNTGALAAANKVVTDVAAFYGARVADAFTSFAVATKPFGGSACRAGLLIRLPDGTCDVHPSPLGRSILAATVSAAVFTAR